MIPIHSYACKLCNYQYPKKVKQTDNNTILSIMKDSKVKITKNVINQLKVYIEDSIWSDDQLLYIGKRDRATGPFGEERMPLEVSHGVLGEVAYEEIVEGEAGNRRVLLNDEDMGRVDGGLVRVEREGGVCFVTRVGSGIECTRSVRMGEDRVVTAVGMSMNDKLDENSVEDMDMFTSDTQRHFNLNRLAKVGRSYKGRSFIKLVVSRVQVDRSKMSGMDISCVRYIETVSDVVCIRFRGTGADEETEENEEMGVEMGAVGSNGSLVVYFVPAGLLGDDEEGRMVRGVRHIDVSVCDELFTTYEHMGEGKVVVGCQSGNVLLVRYGTKVANGWAILRSYNYSNNFFITCICIYPQTAGDGDGMFAVSTSDGVIKIFAEKADHPVMEYQSINVGGCYVEICEVDVLGFEHSVFDILEREREVPAEFSAHTTR